MIKIEKIHESNWSGCCYYYSASEDPVYINPSFVVAIKTTKKVPTDDPRNYGKDCPKAKLTEIVVNAGKSAISYFTEIPADEVIKMLEE